MSPPLAALALRPKADTLNDGFEPTPVMTPRRWRTENFNDDFEPVALARTVTIGMPSGVT